MMKIKERIDSHETVCAKVLLVDDEPDVTKLLAYAMRKEPYVINTALSGTEAMELFKDEASRPDILITDIKMPGLDGIELTRRIKKEFPATEVIVITAHGDIDSAVEAMKLGAADFLQKPINNRSLRMSLKSAAETWRLRKALETTHRELAEEKELLSVTISSINEGLITTDINGNVILMNRMAEKLTGWSCNEAAGIPVQEVFDITTPDMKLFDNSGCLSIPVENEARKGGSGTGILVRRKDDAPVDVSFNVTVLRDANGGVRGSVIVFRDITEKRREEEKAKKIAAERAEMQAQIQRSQKMEAIGMMASGVAHDLNNILSGILSYPELILLDLPEDSTIRQPLMMIQEAAQRAADVVADLLTVARGVAAKKEPVCLNTLIREYLQAPEIRKPLEECKEMRLRLQLAPQLLSVECSPVHIRKCILNLVLNAIDACKQRGVITICTENRHIATPPEGRKSMRAGTYVLVSVNDTGQGIDEKDLEHIFEPFYTKKVMGRSGTGLGLAVVWNIMRDHGGSIEVRTGPEGTTFELYFPASDLKAITSNPDDFENVPMGNGEKILVVDDEPTQRDIASALLERLGYKVHTVRGGLEAVEYIKNNPVDLILLDMIMDQGISGRETYEQIIKLYPGQRAVIASGYSETEDVRRAQELGAGIFISKPYTLAQLGKAVRQELERRQ